MEQGNLYLQAHLRWTNMESENRGKSNILVHITFI